MWSSQRSTSKCSIDTMSKCWHMECWDAFTGSTAIPTKWITWLYLADILCKRLHHWHVQKPISTNWLKAKSALCKCKACERVVRSRSVARAGGQLRSSRSRCNAQRWGGPEGVRPPPPPTAPIPVRVSPNAMPIIVGRDSLPDATHLRDNMLVNRIKPTKTTDQRVRRLGMRTEVRPGRANPQDMLSRRDHRKPTTGAWGRHGWAVRFNRKTPTHDLASMPVHTRRARTQLRKELVRDTKTRVSRNARIAPRRPKPTLESGEPPKVTEPMRVGVRKGKGGRRIPSKIPKPKGPQRRNLPPKTRRRLRQGGEEGGVDKVGEPRRRPPLM